MVDKPGNRVENLIYLVGISYFYDNCHRNQLIEIFWHAMFTRGYLFFLDGQDIVYALG